MAGKKQLVGDRSKLKFLGAVKCLACGKSYPDTEKLSTGWYAEGVTNDGRVKRVLCPTCQIRIGIDPKSNQLDITP